MGVMSTNSIRREASFLTDKMAYELNLNNDQIDATYEINYDFYQSVRYLLDDVVMEYSYAVNAYNEKINNRNDDLSYVFNSFQYDSYLSRDYFVNPIRVSLRSGWSFGIYLNYSNPQLYYYGNPDIYRTYRGAHSRMSYGNSYYRVRIENHPYYSNGREAPHHSTYRGNVNNGGSSYNNNNVGNININIYNNRTNNTNNHSSNYNGNKDNINNGNPNVNNNNRNRNNNNNPPINTNNGNSNYNGNRNNNNNPTINTNNSNPGVNNNNNNRSRNYESNRNNSHFYINSNSRAGFPKTLPNPSSNSSFGGSSSRRTSTPKASDKKDSTTPRRSSSSSRR
jgi:hypothetical protein